MNHNKKSMNKSEVDAFIKKYMDEHNGTVPTNVMMRKESKPNPAVKLRNAVGAKFARWIPVFEKKKGEKKNG